jgi:hypothetical protein
MPEQKGLVESLLDFSFRETVGKRYAKLLYALHLFAGLVAAIALVVNGFQASPAQGLLALLIAVVSLFFWTLYVRVTIEILLAIYSMAENLGRVSGGSGQQ